MRKNYGYKYFSNQRKKSFLKKLSFVSSLLLIAQISLGGLLYVAPAAQTLADNGNCEKPIDVVLIMDRSGSMDYTSKCDWWKFECINSPSCSLGYAWVKNTDYNQTQSWCDGKNQPAPRQSVYLSINPKKITAAKDAANSFIDKLQSQDQSALISYANSATLDKQLSGDHPATKTAVSGLITNGATNIGDAIKLGIGELLSGRANPQATHAMILLTDGLANKPNGPGYGEWPADVAYAQSQAVLAAAANFKIFTIGLGTDGETGEINEAMLENIATTTGAAYYHAPTQNNLQAIYDSISNQVCQYGSISGCKYSDVNNNGIVDQGEETVNDWEITLTGGNNGPLKQTTKLGCYIFSGLVDGTYAITETITSGSIATNPGSGNYTGIIISGHNDVANINFINYYPYCGNNIKDNGEECDDGNIINNDGCSAQCTTEASQPVCGDHLVNGSEVCDGNSQSCQLGGYNGSKSCLADCSGWGTCQTNEYCGDGIINNSEECEGSATNFCTTINGYTGTQTCGGCVWGQCQANQSCGDGVKNGAEQCDGTAGVGVNQSCSDTCALINLPYCGDGAVNGAEICDNGANNGLYGYCNSSCTEPTPAVCGNGTKEGAEQCDDGNIISGDGCSAVCQTEGSGGGEQKGSLKICKYEDSDGLASTTADRSAVSNWNFSVWDGTATSTPQLTLADGCAIFSALTPGQYLINEESRTGWYYLEPTVGLATTTVSANQQAIINFYNVRYGKISGYEYMDADGLASTTLDRTGLGDWTVNLFNSQSSTTPLISTTTLADGYFEFLNLLPNNYSLTQNLKVSWINIISPAEINLLSGETKIDNNFVNSQTGGQGGGEAVCGNGVKEGAEQCDGSDGVTGGYTCNSQCVLVSTGQGGGGSDNGGGGGGGSIPLCILTNTCGSSNPISISTPAGAASPSSVASSTGGVLGEKITKPGTSQVLGEKIAAKPAGQVLSDTGFKLSEFLSLLAVLLLLLNLIFIIKTKYLKAGSQNHGLLNKTLIFDQDLFIYQRADVYFKNR